MKFTLKQLFIAITLLCVGIGTIRHCYMGYAQRWEDYRQGYIDGYYWAKQDWKEWRKHNKNKTSPRYDRYTEHPNGEDLPSSVGVFEPPWLSQ